MRGLRCHGKTALFLLALGGVLASPAAALQSRSSHGILAGSLDAGLRGGRDFENHAWSIGAQLRVPVGSSLELRPSGDLFYPKEGEHGHQLNADAAIRFGQSGLYACGR